MNKVATVILLRSNTTIEESMFALPLFVSCLKLARMPFIVARGMCKSGLGQDVYNTTV